MAILCQRLFAGAWVIVEPAPFVQYEIDHCDAAGAIRILIIDLQFLIGLRVGIKRILKFVQNSCRHSAIYVSRLFFSPAMPTPSGIIVKPKWSPPSTDHSCRSATSGSTAVARRAGKYDASNPTPASKAATNR